MGLKEKYDAWNFKPIMPGDGKNPRNQSLGSVAVDFLQNTYQTEVRNRTPGNTVVTQATADDDTKGTFNKTTEGGKQSAFLFYTKLTTSTKLMTYNSKLVHIYNAQGTYPNAKFITSNSYKNSKGVLYTTNPPS